MKKELELYLHIPFCIRKCGYCDFLSGPQNEEMTEKYVNVLLREILKYRPLSPNFKITTIFMGGGTPSVLTGRQMKMIFKALYEVFDIDKSAEITVEANPGTVTKEKLTAYRTAGINRISFGLQSTNDEELKMLGRIHTYEIFLESYRLARAAGFENINVDLISAIPGQTLKSWEETLGEVIGLKPEHISAYSLIVEEGTPFAEMYGEGKPRERELPSEEEEREIYERTEQLLGKAGYHRYEISNYAKEGRECRHNLGYWERKNYLGLGLGASSMVENVRFRNTDNLEEYIKADGAFEKIRREEERLSIEEQMEEFVFLGLRKMEGISEMEFEQNFAKSIWDCYGENIQGLIKRELLERRGERLRLTKKGIDISNYVFAQFLYQ